MFAYSNTAGRGVGLFVAFGTSTCSRGEADCTELVYSTLCLVFLRRVAQLKRRYPGLVFQDLVSRYASSGRSLSAHNLGYLLCFLSEGQSVSLMLRSSLRMFPLGIGLYSRQKWQYALRRGPLPSYASSPLCAYYCDALIDRRAPAVIHLASGYSPTFKARLAVCLCVGLPNSARNLPHLTNC